MGRSECFDARTNVGHFPQSQLFLTPCSTHLPHNDQSSVYTKTYCQSDAFVLFETGIQGSYRRYDSQTRSYSSLGIIFMGLGVAKIHQETITQELGNVSVKTLDHFGTHPLIGTHHVTPVFWIELRGQFGGINEVTKHDCEVPTFSFRYGW